MRTIDRDSRKTTEWMPLQLMNSWVAYSASDPPQWRISDGNVEFRGAIKSGTLASSSTVAILPTRVSQRSIRPLGVDNGASNIFGQLMLDVDGTLKQDRALGGNTAVWLAGLKFPII